MYLIKPHFSYSFKTMKEEYETFRKNKEAYTALEAEL